VVSDAFRNISGTLEWFQGGRLREVLTVGAVGTFVTGWLLPRLDAFHAAYPSRLGALRLAATRV
jgi:LysR family transcriptional regulator of beta-lactamase